MGPVVRKAQRVEQSVKFFCIRKIQNKTFQFPSIFHCVSNSIADFFDSEEILQVIQNSKEEIEQVVEIASSPEKERELIRFLPLFFDCP